MSRPSCRLLIHRFSVLLNRPSLPSTVDIANRAGHVASMRATPRGRLIRYTTPGALAHAAFAGSVPAGEHERDQGQSPDRRPGSTGPPPRGVRSPNPPRRQGQRHQRGRSAVRPRGSRQLPGTGQRADMLGTSGPPRCRRPWRLGTTDPGPAPRRAMKRPGSVRSCAGCGSRLWANASTKNAPQTNPAHVRREVKSMTQVAVPAGGSEVAVQQIAGPPSLLGRDRRPDPRAATDPLQGRGSHRLVHTPGLAGCR